MLHEYRCILPKDLQDKLLFRRQFILSSQEFEPFEQWNHIELDHGFFLSAHPDLALTVVKNNKFKLILLGFILDPFSPEMSNRDILDDLVSRIDGWDGLISNKEKYSGRWVMIYQDDTRINLLHDPCGQRQVYYHLRGEGIICGSDTAIINYFFHLQPDPSPELKKFITSDSFRLNENKWIGDGTVYLYTKHLMPNYYLNLLERKTTRYWPTVPLKPIGLYEGVKAGSDILVGTLQAASKRQKLAVAVTAGWDSRILLAASKSIRKEITYYVSVNGADYENDPDFYVPYNLFRKLGLPFNIQECNEVFPDELEKIYLKNIKAARLHLKKSKFIYKHLLESQNKTIINGNACEIFRIIPYLRPIRYRKHTAVHLAKEFLASPDLPYVEYHLDSWLQNMSLLCTKNHLDLYGMINWEQRIGNWGALYPAEQDIAVDQLSPFNNRLLIRLMMSVDLKYRIFPNYLLFKNMIKSLWPELLSEPINPKTFRGSLRLWGRHLLVKHFYGY